MTEPQRAKPYTKAELDEIRKNNPLWPSYAWLSTVDFLEAKIEMLRELLKAVRLDCQPKSKEDAVYVSDRWRQEILKIAGEIS